jgi:hypothetical protein
MANAPGPEIPIKQTIRRRSLLSWDCTPVFQCNQGDALYFRIKEHIQ